MLPPAAHYSAATSCPLQCCRQRSTAVLPPAAHCSAATGVPLQCCRQRPTTVLPPAAHCSAATSGPLQCCHQLPTAVLPPAAHCSAATSCPLQCCHQRSTAHSDQARLFRPLLLLHGHVVVDVGDERSRQTAVELVQPLLLIYYVLFVEFIGLILQRGLVLAEGGGEIRSGRSGWEGALRRHVTRTYAVVYVILEFIMMLILYYFF